jgi:ubiquinone/menaquinone biosynthesis C-methylase UbiE
MKKLRNFVTSLHQSSKRDYLPRMVDNKPLCMLKAKEYAEDYWDGDRRYGYGGYVYMPGRWKSVAEDLIETYQLKSGSKILDVGCGKGFLMHEMLLIEPNLKLTGFDISSYAIENASPLVKDTMTIADARKPFQYKDNEFDLVISLGTLHNLKFFDLIDCLDEMKRVAEEGYIMVESYRNEEELFNLQCWALTCETFLDYDTWVKLISSYKIFDYEFIFFE